MKTDLITEEEKQKILKQKDPYNKESLFNHLLITKTIDQNFLREMFYKFGCPWSAFRKVKNIQTWLFWQDVSEDFIRQFQDYVDWNVVSNHQWLSQQFMREFEDKLNWEYISYKQNFKEDFIREFRKKLSKQNLMARPIYHIMKGFDALFD